MERTLATALALGCLAACSTSTSHATSVMEVEEHWTAPVPAVSPRPVTTVMNPTTHFGGDFFVVTIFRHRPEKVLLRLQHWRGDYCFASTDVELPVDGPMLRWTQRLSVKGGRILFDTVPRRQPFVMPTYATRLNNYSPATSVQFSTDEAEAGPRLERIRWRTERNPTWHERSAPFDPNEPLVPE